MNWLARLLCRLYGHDVDWSDYVRRDVAYGEETIICPRCHKLLEEAKG